jgi:hypothetical protein
MKVYWKEVLKAFLHKIPSHGLVGEDFLEETVDVILLFSFLFHGGGGMKA